MTSTHLADEWTSTVEGMLIIAIVATVGLLVAVAHYLDCREEWRRTAHLANVADRLGFEFHPARDRRLLRRLKVFPLISRGRFRKLWNVLHAEGETLQVILFDFRDHQRTSARAQTVVCFQFEDVPLPRFSLHRAGLGERIEAWLGVRGIELEEHPEFSRAWILHGNDATAVRRLFTDEVVGFYECNPGLTTEAAGGGLLIYLDGKRITPRSIREFLDAAFEVQSLLRSAAQASRCIDS